MAACCVLPAGRWAAAPRPRHSPPSRPARLGARFRSACRAPADGAFALPRRLLLAFAVAAEFPIGLLVLDLCSGHDSSFAALHVPVLAGTNQGYLTRVE